MLCYESEHIKYSYVEQGTYQAIRNSETTRKTTNYSRYTRYQVCFSIFSCVISTNEKIKDNPNPTTNFFPFPDEMKVYNEGVLPLVHPDVKSKRHNESRKRYK